MLKPVYLSHPPNPWGAETPPFPMEAAGESKPAAYCSHPPTPELPRQLVTRVGYVEDLVELRTPLKASFSILILVAAFAA